MNSNYFKKQTRKKTKPNKNGISVLDMCTYLETSKYVAEYFNHFALINNTK